MGLRKIFQNATARVKHSVGLCTTPTKWVLSGIEGKTSWEWLELLIVPLFLAAGAFYLENRVEQRQERIATERYEQEAEIADARAKQETLDNYLEQMQTLLLDRDLRNAPEDSEVRSVARAITVTAIKELGNERNALLISFLQESNLIQKVESSRNHSEAQPSAILVGLDLSGADLSEADLSEADLSSANLTKVKLRRTNLEKADLSSANLTEARLLGASLSRADLSGSKLRATDLSFADLSEADLSAIEGNGVLMTSASGLLTYLPWSLVHSPVMAPFRKEELEIVHLRQSNLSGANLTGANLSGADLTKANLEGANLSNADIGEFSRIRTKIEEHQITESILCKTQLPEKFRIDSHRDCS